MADTTRKLEEQLQSTHPSELGRFFRENKEKMALPPALHPFYVYYTERLKERKMTQRQVMAAVGISEEYGRKIILGEKKSRNRDLILALCLYARFTVQETNRALQLYGMAPLYARNKRDAILLAAAANRLYEPETINQLLLSQGEDILRLSAAEQKQPPKEKNTH